MAADPVSGIQVRFTESLCLFRCMNMWWPLLGVFTVCLSTCVFLGFFFFFFVSSVFCIDQWFSLMWEPPCLRPVPPQVVEETNPSGSARSPRETPIPSTCPTLEAGQCWSLCGSGEKQLLVQSPLLSKWNAHRQGEIVPQGAPLHGCSKHPQGREFP